MAIVHCRIFALMVLLAPALAFCGSLPSWRKPPADDASCQATPDAMQQQADQPSDDNKRTDLESSKPVRVNGVEFQAIVARQVRVPAVGEQRDISFYLRVNNMSDKPLLFLNTVRFTLTTASGKPLPKGQDKNPYPVEWTRVIPGGTVEHLYSFAALEWMPADKTLRLRGSNATDEMWWFGGVEPGHYILTAEYDWEGVGKVTTEPVRFEIVPTLAGLNQSPPVYVYGVEFQAAAEPKFVSPRQGKRAVNYGLCITNRTTTVLNFNLFDTRGIWLRNEAGESMECWYEREETSYTSPTRVAPGKTATVLDNAYVTSGPGDELRLFGYESGGEWSFDGLRPGKYYLSFGYHNTEEMVTEFYRTPLTTLTARKLRSFWYGEVRTKEVEIEIMAPK
jgi:hypothetical protein